MTDLMEFVCGDAEVIPINVTTPGGVAVDISGWTITIMFDFATTLVKTATLIDATSGTASLTMNAVDTESVTPGTYYFQMRMNNGAGIIQTTVDGLIRLYNYLGDD